MSLLWALAVGGWSTPRPGHVNPGIDTRCPLYRRLDRSRVWSERVRKILSPPGFETRTVQPVASPYIDYAILAALSGILTG